MVQCFEHRELPTVAFADLYTVPSPKGGTIHRIKADDAKNSDLTDKNTPLTLGSVLNEKDCQNRMSPVQSLE